MRRGYSSRLDVPVVQFSGSTSMTRFVGKKVHSKDTCLDEIGLCAQKRNILSGSTIKMV